MVEPWNSAFWHDAERLLGAPSTAAGSLATFQMVPRLTEHPCLAGARRASQLRASTCQGGLINLAPPPFDAELLGRHSNASFAFVHIHKAGGGSLIRMLEAQARTIDEDRDHWLQEVAKPAKGGRSRKGK